MRHYAEGETMKRVMACLGFACYAQAHVNLDTIQKKEFAQSRLAHMQSILAAKQKQERVLARTGNSKQRAQLRSDINRFEKQMHIAQTSLKQL